MIKSIKHQPTFGFYFSKIKRIKIQKLFFFEKKCDFDRKGIFKENLKMAKSQLVMLSEYHGPGPFTNHCAIFVFQLSNLTYLIQHI